MDISNTLIATVYIKGGKDVQIPIEEAVNYLYDNATKIESRYREVRRTRLTDTDSLITSEDKSSNSSN